MIPLSSYEITTNDDPTLNTISLTLFVAGCVRRCVGCQNPELQEVNEKNHELLSINQVKKIINNKLCLIRSVCFCGGDFLPLYNKQFKELIIFSKSLNLKTILYTGELFEHIDNYFQNNINIIIDGPYDCNKKTNKFPASSNQRCWINGQLVNCDDLEINKI
jgi:anaerobic ribonucleoside-triphosphate reductase activating protein